MGTKFLSAGSTTTCRYPMMSPNLRGWGIRRLNRGRRPLAPPFDTVVGPPPNDGGGRNSSPLIELGDDGGGRRRCGVGRRGPQSGTRWGHLSGDTPLVVARLRRRAMTDPITRLNTALKGRYAIECQLGEDGGRERGGTGVGGKLKKIRSTVTRSGLTATYPSCLASSHTSAAATNLIALSPAWGAIRNPRTTLHARCLCRRKWRDDRFDHRQKKRDPCNPPHRSQHFPPRVSGPICRQCHRLAQQVCPAKAVQCHPNHRLVSRDCRLLLQQPGHLGHTRVSIAMPPDQSCRAIQATGLVTLKVVYQNFVL